MFNFFCNILPISELFRIEVSFRKLIPTRGLSSSFFKRTFKVKNDVEIIMFCKTFLRVNSLP